MYALHSVDFFFLQILGGSLGMSPTQQNEDKVFSDKIEILWSSVWVLEVRSCILWGHTGKGSGFTENLEMTRDHCVSQSVSHWNWPCQSIFRCFHFLGRTWEDHHSRTACLSGLYKKLLIQQYDFNKLVLLGHLAELALWYECMCIQTNREIAPY